MLLFVRIVVLLAFCALGVKPQLTHEDGIAASSDSAQLVLDDAAGAPSEVSLLDYIKGDYYHFMGYLRERMGYTLHSYTYAMISNSASRAPPLVEPRLSYFQTCSIKIFAQDRRDAALKYTLKECKSNLQFDRSMDNATSPDPTQAVLFKGCCQARHYGVLQTCVKITFDGSNPDDIANSTCLCGENAFPSEDLLQSLTPWAA